MARAAAGSGETNGIGVPLLGRARDVVPLARGRPAPEHLKMPPLLQALVLFGLSAAAIYVACEFFVNGIEWVGHRFDFAQKATGTILAAFGTALPESVVTFVAVAFGEGDAQKEIGVGAALGGPLVLGTLAYAVVGWALFVSRRRLRSGRTLHLDYRHLSRDQGWFLLIFVAKITLGLFAFAFKPWLGAAFLLAYAAYFRAEMRGKRDEAEGALEPLRFAPRQVEPSTAIAVAQTLTALVVIFEGSRVFVAQLDVLGPWLGMPPQLVALLLGPVATELPEILNAVIWIRQGKVRLALANISGAMMIQATVPTAFGLFFTPWLLEPALVWAGVVTALSVLALCATFRRGHASRGVLSLFGLFYLLFAGGLLVFGG
jgi:cation:H+ antiporter